MLGDEVAGQRVQTTGEEGGEEQIENGVPGAEVEEGQVEGELDDDVEEVNTGQGDAVDGHGAQGVEEDLEGAEESLSEDGVEDEGFEGSGKVGVEAVNAQGLVVGKVIGLGIRQYFYCLSTESNITERTLKEALYGIPMGRFAKMAIRRFA